MKEMGTYLISITVSCGLACNFIFNQMQFNFRYDNTTGMFTVPPGGEGYYYFSTYLFVVLGEWGRFGIQINGELLCTAQTSHSTDNYGPAVCSGA